MDAINAYINEIIRKEREYTEKSLAEIVEKYDFIVCSTECMNQLQEILPEGAKIAYSPYIGDPSTIYVIKKFDMMDLLNKAIKEEQDAAEDKEWGTMEERMGKESGAFAKVPKFVRKRSKHTGYGPAPKKKEE